MYVKIACEGFLDYCRRERQLSLHTMAAYEQDLAELGHFFAGRPIAAIAGEELVNYSQYLATSRRLAPATVKRRLASARAMFNRLAKQRVIAATPFASIELRVHIPKRLPRCLSSGETTILLSAAQIGSDGTHLAALLLFVTGIRVSELAAIRVGDVDLDQGAIRIFGKGSRERMVFLPDNWLIKLVSSYINRHHNAKTREQILLLNARGKPASVACLRGRIKGLAKRAGMNRVVTPHMLRHTAATALLEAGVDIRIVQRLLGHQSIATTQIYTHVSDVALKAAIINANVCRSVRGSRSFMSP